MDRLSTYALVAAIKELYEKQPQGQTGRTDNARWISLRTWMANSDATQWIPPQEATHPEILQQDAITPTAFAPPTRGYINQITQRHDRALQLYAQQYTAT